MKKVKTLKKLAAVKLAQCESASQDLEILSDRLYLILDWFLHAKKLRNRVVHGCVSAHAPGYQKQYYSGNFIIFPKSVQTSFDQGHFSGKCFYLTEPEVMGITEKDNFKYNSSVIVEIAHLISNLWSVFVQYTADLERAFK